MKAGIYKLFDGGLIYVRKDRTVSAVAGTTYPIQTGSKVSTLEGGKYVLALDGDKQFQGERHADVPNGCTDHQALVGSMHMAANLRPGERVVDYGTERARVEQTDPPAAKVALSGLTPRAVFAVPPGGAEWPERLLETMRLQGFRFCSKVSARKHRKRGHAVVPMGGGRFAWRPDYLYPYQRKYLGMEGEP